ncbi:molybdate ABC transporter substrate-binding protein [Ferrigenium sp. UT5]|uniref:molybdate ABC transporter substrate-binding protein n=1 Tax=Ferrigenium sp. UT5 TaxID=3242105 RepID=UPI00354C74CB
MHHSKSFGRIVAVLALLGGLNGPLSAAEIRVAAAADFAAPMKTLAALFQQESGYTVVTSLGASGKLYAQIRKGAAFDVFLSADEEMPKRLLQEGLAITGSRFVYAIGRLVLWSAQPGFADDTVLNRGNFSKLAIANPLYSPYGMAAKETMTKLTMWNAMQRKLDRSDDVLQTYRMAATEKADLAFIALSQVMKNGKVSVGSWWLVPPEMHTPLRQSAVLLNGAQDQAAAQAFLAFLKSEKARKVMRGFGYELP